MKASLLLINTKFPHNVGSALRAASCFGAASIYWTGERVSVDIGKGQRLPREERMREYKDVTMGHLTGRSSIRPIDHLVKEGTPIAIELLPGSIPLHHFDHPLDAVYVFGPEDGSLPQGIRRACHQFVQIPSFHCLNLAAAVYLTLYDRAIKLNANFGIPMPSLPSGGANWHTSSLDAS